MTNVTEQVSELMKELTGAEEVCLTDSLQGTLSMDSLSLVTLLVELEDRFQIELKETDMNPSDLTTVSDVVNLVTKYLGEQDEKES